MQGGLCMLNLTVALHSSDADIEKITDLTEKLAARKTFEGVKTSNKIGIKYIPLSSHSLTWLQLSIPPPATWRRGSNGSCVYVSHLCLARPPLNFFLLALTTPSSLACES